MEITTTTTLVSIMSNVGTLVGGIGTVFNAIDGLWFVYLPITMSVGTYLFAKTKGLLWFRRGRRGR